MGRNVREWDWVDDGLGSRAPTTAHMPSPPIVRALRRTVDGLVEVVVNHRVDGELIEHREWVRTADSETCLLRHANCPGAIVGVYVDGRALPL